MKIRKRTFISGLLTIAVTVFCIYGYTHTYGINIYLLGAKWGRFLVVTLPWFTLAAVIGWILYVVWLKQDVRKMRRYKSPNPNAQFGDTSAFMRKKQQDNPAEKDEEDTGVSEPETIEAETAEADSNGADSGKDEADEEILSWIDEERANSRKEKKKAHRTEKKKEASESDEDEDESYDLNIDSFEAQDAEE